MDQIHSRHAGKAKPRKNNPTFEENGKRRVSCPACGVKLATKGGGAIYTYIGETKPRSLECCCCKELFTVNPPYKITDENGDDFWMWGVADNPTATAVLTPVDCEATIPAEDDLSES